MGKLLKTQLQHTNVRGHVLATSEYLTVVWDTYSRHGSPHCPRNVGFTGPRPTYVYCHPDMVKASSATTGAIETPRTCEHPLVTTSWRLQRSTTSGLLNLLTVSRWCDTIKNYHGIKYRSISRL